MAAGFLKGAPSFWDLAYRDGDHLRIWEDPRPPAWIAELVELERLRGAPGVDIGCGGGWSTLEAARRGVRIVGVDRSPWAVALARRRALDAGIDARFCRGDALALPLADASVRLAIDRACFHIFTERATRRRAAAETARVVRPGGILVLEGSRRADEEAGLGRVDAETAATLFAPAFSLERLESDVLRSQSDDLPSHRLTLRRLDSPERFI